MSQAAPFDLQAFLKQMQDQYNQRNSDSMSQYQNLMRGVNVAGQNVANTYADARQSLIGSGDVQKAQIGENTTKQQAASQQSLVSRGLGNTTIQDTTTRGINADAAKANAAVDANVNAGRTALDISKAGSQENTANLWANSVLSKTNQGPDMSQYLALIQNLMANGGGGAVNMGGGGSPRPMNRSSSLSNFSGTYV